ncbi:hypothetical protein MPTK1_8g00370 [Marchantia polymorpha subsp. ruderalis]|uniref:Uncharacterized protein n=1 Tax=Marchantia polymorpha TaxID=3197 RepID=A0A2R6WLG7_MARPO|nr:hypothetical protein MARPO_0077s0029 [Marchantia polymorpha]BBN18179.1 hypothetical protein Mp_8g00370 [Marchantia polymorpha subsp. ruderalis]|eukprot:PTQ34700.1 hypothetical protein MARPO_0077s0029 [Marchantia polymorpha]
MQRIKARLHYSLGLRSSYLRHFPVIHVQTHFENIFYTVNTNHGVCLFVRQELQKHGSPGIVMALVGNKADLEESREVASEDSQAYAESNGMFFIETSAKLATNVNLLFEEIGQRLPRGQPTQKP